MTDAPEPEQPSPERDPLARFQNWHAFLFVAVAVNVLYLWGMMGQMGDPNTAMWYRALTWLPFNLITTVLYYVFYVKLTGAGADKSAAIPGQDSAPGMRYAFLCLAMVIINWVAMFAA